MTVLMQSDNPYVCELSFVLLCHICSLQAVYPTHNTAMPTQEGDFFYKLS